MAKWVELQSPPDVEGMDRRRMAASSTVLFYEYETGELRYMRRAGCCNKPACWFELQDVE